MKSDKTPIERAIEHTTSDAKAAKKAGDDQLNILLSTTLAKLHGLHAERLAEGVAK